MSELRPIAVHAEEVAAGPATPGIAIRRHLDRDGRWIGWSGWIRNKAGDVSGWHHHAANDTYVYVIRDSVATEFGPGGAERIEARAGEFFRVPAHTIHRERTGPNTDAEAFIMRVGGEPEKVDVHGPDGAGR